MRWGKKLPETGKLGKTPQVSAAMPGFAFFCPVSSWPLLAEVSKGRLLSGLDPRSEWSTASPGDSLPNGFVQKRRLDVDAVVGSADGSPVGGSLAGLDKLGRFADRTRLGRSADLIATVGRSAEGMVCSNGSADFVTWLGISAELIVGLNWSADLAMGLVAKAGLDRPTGTEVELVWS